MLKDPRHQHQHQERQWPLEEPLGRPRIAHARESGTAAAAHRLGRASLAHRQLADGVCPQPKEMNLKPRTKD